MLEIYEVQIESTTGDRQIISTVAGSESDAMQAHEIPDGWRAIAAQELYYTPIEVLEVAPSYLDCMVRVRSKIGWVTVSAWFLKDSFAQGLNYRNKGIVHEGGAMQHVRFIYSPEQIAQLNEYPGFGG